MSTQLHPGSYEAYLSAYQHLPAGELVEIFNRSHANNGGWTSAKANAGAALRHCFLHSGFDVRDFIAGDYMHGNAPLEITGNRIKRQR